MQNFTKKQVEELMVLARDRGERHGEILWDEWKEETINQLLNMDREIKCYLLTHETFDKLAAFYSDDPSEDEVIKVVEETYNKKVDNYEMLDYENFKFNFADDTNVQLLLRDSKYV